MEKKLIVQIIIFAIIFINLLPFLMFGIDKIRAVNKTWRISEKALLKFSILGPFGGFLGMKVFRHKINKPRFYVGIPFFAIIQLIIIIIAVLVVVLWVG